MTTYKLCRRCNKVVKFAPIPELRTEYSVVYYPTCFGGNRPDLCGEHQGKYLPVTPENNT